MEQAIRKLVGKTKIDTEGQYWEKDLKYWGLHLRIFGAMKLLDIQMKSI